MYKRMLIPLDGSNTAEKVLPYARRLAAVENTLVELLSVIEMTDIAADISPADAPEADARVKEARSNSEDYLSAVAQTLPNRNVSWSAVQGRPEEVIIERAGAGKDTLIAMATHGRSGVHRLLLGSTTEKVFQGSQSPLLIVRAIEGAKTEGEAELSSVIIPLDGSQWAESIVPLISSLAKALQLQVILMRAYEPASSYIYSRDSFKDEAVSYLNRIENILRTGGVSSVSSVVLEGAAGDAIIDLARKTPDNLIVMSSRRHSGLKRWVLGSVTDKILRHCEGPVLVLHY